MTRADNRGGTAWTPGPWFTDPSQDDPQQTWIGTRRREQGSEWHGLATVVTSLEDECSGEIFPSEEGEANARLIAAAPELYAVVAKFVEHCTFDTLGKGDNLDNLFAEATVALRKATGDPA
jgi:hypothetical protein